MTRKGGFISLGMTITLPIITKSQPSRKKLGLVHVSSLIM